MQAEFLERHNGDKIAAAVDTAQRLMQGEPAAHKAGYLAENAILAAADLFGLESPYDLVRIATKVLAPEAEPWMTEDTVMAARVCNTSGGFYPNLVSLYSNADPRNRAKMEAAWPGIGAANRKMAGYD